MDAAGFRFKAERMLGENRVTFAEAMGRIGPGDLVVFTAATDRSIKEGVRNLVLDCGELEYIASAVFAAFVEYTAAFRDRGGHMVLVGVPCKISLLIEMLGALPHLCLACDEDEALDIIAGVKPPPPAPPAGQIFVCWRRTDSPHATDRIYERLTRRFGTRRVVRDIDSFPAGTDFREQMRKAARSCRVLIAVIGAEWLGARDESGRRRLDDSHDYVRTEIEVALDQNVPVIPVLVDGAPMPPAEALPDSLKQLSYQGGLQVRVAPDFEADVDRLIQAAERYV